MRDILTEELCQTTTARASGGATVQDADAGDTETSIETLIQAAEQIEAVRPDGDGLREVVGDKGYHSNQALKDDGQTDERVAHGTPETLFRSKRLQDIDTGRAHGRQE